MMSSNKRLKETQIDRLSELPDHLIIQIFSLLEVKQSAITSVLSKRWRYFWRESPRLIFREESSRSKKVGDFVNGVNRALLAVCGRMGLETLEFEFLDNYNSYNLDVDVWVRFAVKNRVKQVSLLLDSHSYPMYTLPQMMFHNLYLKRLTLQRCALDPRRTIVWPSLTELHIKNVELQEHVIGKILSGCPVLYRLVLEYCWGFKCLEVGSKSLYELEVCDRKDGLYHSEPLLRISAPYVQTLCVSMDAKGRNLCFGNISCLVKATIGFIGSNWVTDTEEVVDNTKKLLEETRHVKEVKTRGGYSQVLSSMAMTGYQFPQSARTCLTVDAPAEKRSIHGIVGLLESSPNLETLVIEGSSFIGEPYRCPDVKSDLDRDLLHLKTITIKEFIDPNLAGEPMLTLARILLKRAPALEKMVVKIHGIATASSSRPSLSKTFKIKQTLLSYPKSSKNAVILLD